MTIKQDLEDEAGKLATAVRDALNEFSKQTGLQAGIHVDWVSVQQLDRAGNDYLVGDVRVVVGGLSVSA